MASKSAVDSDWWMHHAVLSILVWIGGPALLIGQMMGVWNIPEGIPQAIGAILLLGYMFALFIFSWTSLFGYYHDAKAIGESTDWKPFWQLYVIAHFLLGAPFVAPFYLIRRGWKVGNDWNGFVETIRPGGGAGA